MTPPPPTSALGRCVGDAGAFLAEAFGRACHRWRSEGFTDLLSLADIDEAIAAGGLRRPAVRLARDGQTLPPSSFSRRARTGSVWVDDLVDPGRTLAAFADGATIVLNSLHRWWPPLGRFCRQLGQELGHPVQANAYLTPAGASGFAPHHDTHDVLILQVEGTKRWTVREPLVEAPLERHRSDHAAAGAQAVLLDDELRPGDCLYLPRGFVHSAAAEEEASLHLTIGVLARTRHDLARRILDRTADDPAFRQSLPVRYAHDPLTAAQVVKDLVTDLQAWLEGLPVEEVARDLVWREATGRPVDHAGQLLELAGSRPVADDTVVEPRPGLAWRFTPTPAPAGDEPAPPAVGTGPGPRDPERPAVATATVAPAGPAPSARVVLELADRALDLPATLVPALTRLLSGPATPVGDLGHLLDEGSRRVLVRRLLREGVLRRVDGS